MVVKKERAQKINGSEEYQGVFLKIWVDSFAEVTKMWEESYLSLHKPWIETTEELVAKAAELSKDATPKKYEEFFDTWTKAYRKNIGQFNKPASMENNAETLKKLMDSARESSKLYKSWIDELDENTRKTEKLLSGKADTAEYKKSYDTWMKSYKKIFDQLLDQPAMKSTRETLEKQTGLPDIYFGSFDKISKLWRDSYSRLYEPWIESVSKLSRKTEELSQGSARPEDFQEFYTLWMDIYQETYGNYGRPSQPTKEIFDSFVSSTDTYLNMYKSWIAALEKMVEKTHQLSEQGTHEDISKEFYGFWINMYENAFSSFFEDMPSAGPMKNMIEPVKTMAKLNADAFARMSKMWAKSFRGEEDRAA